MREEEKPNRDETSHVSQHNNLKVKDVHSNRNDQQVGGDETVSQHLNARDSLMVVLKRLE